MPLFIRWLPSLIAALGGIGEYHFKAAAAAWSLAAFAVLVNGYARQLGEEGLGHAVCLPEGGSRHDKATRRQVTSSRTLSSSS
jgi:hypothetical protein